jgi:hypothetical protein
MDEGNFSRVKFELVTYSDVPGVPAEVSQKLKSLGVPGNLLGRYRAAREVAILNEPSFGKLVCFGSSGISSTATRICLEPQTGRIVEAISITSGPILLVNSSLEQFIATVKAVYERFPFDSWKLGEDVTNDEIFDRFWKEWDAAATDLTELFLHIDPIIIDIDGFWTTFLDDMRMGIFATDKILDTHNV